MKHTKKYIRVNKKKQLIIQRMFWKPMNVVNLGCVGFFFIFHINTIQHLLPLQNDQHDNAYFTTNWLKYFTILFSILANSDFKNVFLMKFNNNFPFNSFSEWCLFKIWLIHFTPFDNWPRFKNSFNSLHNKLPSNEWNI